MLQLPCMGQVLLLQLLLLVVILSNQLIDAPGLLTVRSL
jgi:hypothetical protein